VKILLHWHLLDTEQSSAAIYKTLASEIVAGIADVCQRRHQRHALGNARVLVHSSVLCGPAVALLSRILVCLDVRRKFLIVVECLTSSFASHPVLRKHFSSLVHRIVNSRPLRCARFNTDSFKLQNSNCFLSNTP